MHGSSVLCSSMRPPWTLRSREKKSSSSMGPGALLRWSSSLPWACELGRGKCDNQCLKSFLNMHKTHSALTGVIMNGLALLTCVVRIILYRSSLGTGAGTGGGAGAGTGAGFFTKESCFMLPLKLLALDLGNLSSCALWSSSRRA